MSPIRIAWEAMAGQGNYTEDAYTYSFSCIALWRHSLNGQRLHMHFIDALHLTKL